MGLEARREKLDAAVELIESIKSRCDQAVKDVSDLFAAQESEISELKDEIDQEDELGAEVERRESIEDAVNKLLDEVQRPTGSLTPWLPNTPAAQRALLALFDAVKRAP